MLRDVADRPPAEAGGIVGPERVDALAPDPHLAAVGALECRKQVQDRRLPAPGRTRENVEPLGLERPSQVPHHGLVLAGEALRHAGEGELHLALLGGGKTGRGPGRPRKRIVRMERHHDARLFGNRDDTLEEIREVLPHLLVRDASIGM